VVRTASTEPTAAPASDQELAPGAQVGEYQLEAMIGRGGFGSVYRAVHPVIGKHVAIKVLSRRYSADPQIVSRFVSEARAVNQIGHRNIIDIFAFGQLPDGRHYYVMELLEGEPLDRVVERAPLTLAEALPLFRALARALDAAHAKGIAHRDLKPENIFLARDADGSVFPKLLDFGIAKLLVPEEEAPHHTGTGVPLGTPYYMSPEQCRGREVDHRTDIYSFGIVAYRVLTGIYPFTGDYMELMMKQIGEEPVPPSQHVAALPATVDSAIAWMMRKDASQRPPTLMDAVTALDPDAAITAPPAGRSSRGSISPPVGALTGSAGLAVTAPAPATPRSRAAWLLVLLLVVGGGAGAWWWQSSQHEASAPTPSPPSRPAPVATPAPAPASPPAPAVAAPPDAAVAVQPVITKSPSVTHRKTVAHPTKHAPSDEPAEPGHGDMQDLPHEAFEHGTP
jgi:serine/threonine-protein kinase